MARAARNTKKKSTISVDFTDVESSAVLPDDDYVFNIEDVEQKTSDNSGADYLAFKLEVAEGEFEGRTVYHNCSLQPQALFNLRNLLEAAGYEIPKGSMDLDPADLIGEKVGGSTITETYEGKKKARISEFFNPNEDEEEDEEEEKKPASKSKGKTSAPAKKSSKAKEEEPEEEDEEDDKPAAKKAAKKTTKKKAEPEFEVGDKVTFTDDDGDEQSGKITAIDDDNATVKVGKDEWEISLDELTAA